MKITNEIRTKIIESREAGEPRAQTIRRIGCSRGTYDIAVQAYNAAKSGDTDELDRIAKISGPAARWALEFARMNPSAKPTKQPAPKEVQKPVQPKLSDEKQALFLTLFFSELFYLAASGDTSLPFPPVSYGDKDAAFLAYRLGGIRTAVYAMDYETEYLKWRKSVLGEYDIDEQLGGECHEED